MRYLLLAVAGAAAIAQTGISGAQQAIAYLIFALIATVGVAAPVVIYFGMGEASQEMLTRLKYWMGHNNAVIMAVLCLVIGAKLIGDAISGLTGSPLSGISGLSRDLRTGRSWRDNGFRTGAEPEIPGLRRI